MRCQKCSKDRKCHRHHVTYEPERIEVICAFCHSLITAINTRYAKWKGKVKLTNAEREMLYGFFMATDKKILEAVLKKKDKTKAKNAKYKKFYRESEEIKRHMAAMRQG